MMSALSSAFYLLALLFSAQLNAAGHVQDTLFCPQSAQAAPDFTALTRDGISTDRAQLIGSDGAIFVFMPTFDRCGQCQAHAVEMNRAAPLLKQAGWPLSLITARSEGAPIPLQQRLNYHHLSLSDKAMADMFRRLAEGSEHAAHPAEQPYALILFMGADGLIRGIQPVMNSEAYPPGESLVQLIGLFDLPLPLDP